MPSRGSTFGLLIATAIHLAAVGCDEGGRERPLDSTRDARTGSVDGGPIGFDSGTATQPTNVTNVTNPTQNGDAEVCNQTRGTARPAAGTIMFQLDTSGSMNCAPNDRDRNCSNSPGEPGDRWEIFRPVLLEALDSLSESSRIGIMNYPIRPTSNDSPACVSEDPLVDVALLDNAQRGAIRDALATVVPGGFTPTQPAVEFAYERLNEVLDDFNSKFLVLATDGESNICVNCGRICTNIFSCSPVEPACEETSGIETAVDTARQAGIRTFIIGVPGSQNYRDTLSRLATLGDTAAAGCDQNQCANGGNNCCHFDLTNSGDNFGQELRVALLQILGQVQVPCEYAVPEDALANSELSQVAVELTDDNGNVRQIRRPDDWDFSDDQTRVVLSQAICDEVSAYTVGQVNILYGCPLLF